MAGQKTISSTYQPPSTPLVPPTSLIVIGDGNPTPNGDYHIQGSFNGENYYSNVDHSYFIWYDPGGPIWTISSVLNNDFPLSWRTSTADIESLYEPNVGTTGNPVVTLV